MFTVGLTGGIGSGKSTVADCFAALGVPVIDTDVIARDLTAPNGAALQEIRTVFGETVMQADGTLDRAALRRRVFADSAARRQLEAILHPRIRQAVGDMLATLATPYALVVIPLLVETGGYREMLNRVLVADCPEDVQIARVKARNGLADDEIKAILAAQAGRAERLAVADDIIVNTATPEALRAEVAALHQRYLALASTPPGFDFPPQSATIVSSEPMRRGVIHYEYPLSERIRTLLRLESLFERFDAYAASPDPHAHHAALLSLFEMAEVAARADLKSDLLQELDRQKAVLAALRGNPHVQSETLEKVLAAIESAHHGIYQLPGKVGQHLREDDWLMAIKQRAAIPGGMCEFDLPSYHYWLHQSAEQRMQPLQRWLAPFLSIRAAVDIVLGLLRDSGQPEIQHVENGQYQRMLEARNPQLIRVTLDDRLPCVPEISANKYLLNIRFVPAGSGSMRVCTAGPIDFELTFCTL